MKKNIVATALCACVVGVIQPALADDQLITTKQVVSAQQQAASTDVLGPYSTALQRRLKRAWFPPQGRELDRAVVEFRVHRDGVASNIRLVQSSNWPVSDMAAMKAIGNAQPFRPLPMQANDDVVFQAAFCTSSVNPTVEVSTIQQPSATSKD